jgi:hypothetical protein
MGIILSSTAALALLLQLTTQLAAASNFAFFSKHQPNPSAASIHELHSFTAKKKKKVQVFFYQFLCERKIDRISLDFCAKKVKCFGFFFVSIFVHKDDCIFF